LLRFHPPTRQSTRLTASSARRRSHRTRVAIRPWGPVRPCLRPRSPSLGTASTTRPRRSHSPCRTRSPAITRMPRAAATVTAPSVHRRTRRSSSATLIITSSSNNSSNSSSSSSNTRCRVDRSTSSRGSHRHTTTA
jgi:hypothetical protein